MQDRCKKCSVAHIEKQCPKIENVEQWEDYTIEKNLCVRCGVKGCKNAECPRLLVNRFAVQGLAEHTWCGICEEGKIHTLKKCKSTRLCVICKKKDHGAKNCKAWCISCYRKGHSSAQCGTICGDYTNLISTKAVDAEWKRELHCYNCAEPVGRSGPKIDHKYRFCEDDPHCWLCDKFRGPKLPPHGAIYCKNRCYICTKKGHDPHRCKKKGYCSLCRSEGPDDGYKDRSHVGKKCPHFRTIHCSLCDDHGMFDPGHVAKNCPYYERFCEICLGNGYKETAHVDKKCPYYERFCVLCKDDGYEETGHVARTCPFYDAVGGTETTKIPPRYKRFCLLCKGDGYEETGHVARDCPFYDPVEGK